MSTCPPSGYLSLENGNHFLLENGGGIVIKDGSIVTVDDFRTLMRVFPENLYPDDVVQEWLDIAQSFILPGVWGSFFKAAVCKWVAHELIVLYGEPSEDGTTLVLNTGVLESATIARTSWTKNVTLGQVMGAGSYDTTQYGRQWYQWALAKARLSSLGAFGCCYGGQRQIVRF